MIVSTKRIQEILVLDKQQLRNFISFLQDFEQLINNPKFNFSDLMETYKSIDDSVSTLCFAVDYQQFINKYKVLFEMQFQKLLELEDQQLSYFDCFFKDFIQLINIPKFSFHNLMTVYNNIDNPVSKTVLVAYNRNYPKFINKYKVLFENKIISELDFKWFLDFDNYVLKNYEKRDIMLQNINKLVELGIDLVSFDPKCKLRGRYGISFAFENGNLITSTSVATDGQIIWHTSQKITRYKYPVTVENATYVLQYEKKNMHSNDDLLSYEMNLNSLLFDINTLPTYEMLHNNEVLPHKEETAREDAKLNQKYDVIDVLYSIDKSAEATMDLLDRSKELTEKLKTVKGKKETELILSKLEIIKSLYKDIKTLQLCVIKDTEESGLMSADEIQRVLQK